MTSRIVIEQAKGVIAERRQLSVDAAFALLRRHARDRNLRLADLARATVDGSLDVTSLDDPVSSSRLRSRPQLADQHDH